MEQSPYPIASPTSSHPGSELRWWTEIIGGAWVFAMIMVVMAGVFLLVILLARVWVSAVGCANGVDAATGVGMGLFKWIC